MNGSAAQSYPAPSDTEAQVALLRRRLLLRDGVSFLVLSAVAAGLFGLTLALFKSFESHRERLGQSWASKGQSALWRNHPGEAVIDLRAALSYAPDDRTYQLLLAQALAGSGHLEEANNYFLNLWTARPGDGSINLQLARLARRRGDANQAVEFYHAATFGDWGGDGLVRRRQARLELAEYLATRHDISAARTELLIAAGNAPRDAEVNLLIGAKLLAIGDASDGLAVYKNALADAPLSRVALLRAGAASFQVGDYNGAQTLLNRALHDHLGGAATLPASEAQAAAALAHTADRLGDLSLSHDLNAESRSRHLLLAAGIAEARLKACSVAPPSLASTLNTAAEEASGKPSRTVVASKTTASKLAASKLAAAASAALPAVLVDLNARWKTLGRDLRRGAESGDASAQDGLASLIFYTEQGTATEPGSATCGSPSGDDALLLLLAHREAGLPLPSSEALAAEEDRAAALATGHSL